MWDPRRFTTLRVPERPITGKVLLCTFLTAVLELSLHARRVDRQMDINNYANRGIFMTFRCERSKNQTAETNRMIRQPRDRERKGIRRGGRFFTLSSVSTIQDYILFSTYNILSVSVTGLITGLTLRNGNNHYNCTCR
jgi:hypothetical protein